MTKELLLFFFLVTGARRIRLQKKPFLWHDSINIFFVLFKRLNITLNHLDKNISYYIQNTRCMHCLIDLFKWMQL